MWVSTNFGFFSATNRTDKKPAELAASGDSQTLQVRARHISHLENLRKIMGDQLGPTIEIKNRDYQARAYTSPEAWGRALAAISMGIDYDNFKSSVKDYNLHNAYMKVWSAMAEVYGTGYTHSWTNYRNVKRPIKANHVFVPGEGNQKEWCQHGTKKCYYFADEHPVAPTKYEYTAEGTRRKVEPQRGPDGKFVKKSQQLALPAAPTNDFRWSSDDSLEVLDEADQDPAFLSLNKAASKVGCQPKRLRDWMSTQKEWQDYRDGNAWFIPADRIEDLEFKYWAETGR